MKKRILTSVVAIAAAMSLSAAAFAVDPGATNGQQDSEAVTVVKDEETKLESAGGLEIVAPAGSFADTVETVKMVAEVTATDNTAQEAAAKTLETAVKNLSVETEIAVNTKLSITLKDQDDKDVQPNGNVKVTVAYDGVSNIVAYVDGDKFEFIALTVDGNFCCFETSHFSDYYLVKVADDQVEALAGKAGTADDNVTGDPNDPTDDKNKPTGFVLAIVPAAVAAAAVVVSKKRK